MAGRVVGGAAQRAGGMPRKVAEGPFRTPRRRPLQQPMVQARRVPWRETDGSDSNSATIAHARNFLDCAEVAEQTLE